MDQFLNSLFLKSTKDSTPNNVTPKNSVPAQIKLREIGSLTKTPASTKQLKLAAEESLIDVSRIYSESVCDIPNSARSTFLMVFSSDSKLVASTHGDHNIYITELSSGKLISTLRGHPRTPWCIAFHPTSSEVLASGCLGGQVRVWDLHGGSELWVAQSQTVIASLAFHPIHRILAIASYNEIYFWDWSTEKAFAKSITGNDKEKVRYVAFDEAGSKLITGIANMIGTKRTEWDRTWPGSGFSRTVSGSIGTVHSTSNNSVPPPPPPPPPPSDTRITTFCYRYMLARYEQLMRRYRELSGRNPHPPPSNNASSVSRGSEPTRSRDVSAGTDEITASHSSMARHGSNSRVYVLLRRSVGSSANTGSQAGGSTSTVDTATETNRCPITLTGRRRRSVGSNGAGGSGPSTSASAMPTSTLETLVERSPSQSPAARRRRSVGSSAPTDRPSDEAGHPLASRRIPIFNTEQTRDSSTSAQPFSNNCRELLERVGELRSYIQTAWMQAMRSNDNDSDSSSTAIAQLASLMAEIPGGSRQRPWRMIQTPSQPPLPAQTVETSHIGVSTLTGGVSRTDGLSQSSETSQTDESSRIGGPPLNNETARNDAPSQTDTPSQTDVPSSGRLTEVLAAGLRRLRHINRQLRELEGGGDPEEGEESNNLGVITEYNSLRRMEQVLLRRIEEQELQMESEVSRVRRFSSTLLTFDHDYTSTPAGRFISVTLEEALAEDSDSPGPIPSSPPLHPNNESLLENPYFRTMATSLIRERADADRHVPENRFLFNCRNRTNTSQLSMSSSPSIAGQATTAPNSSNQLHRGPNSAENSSSRPPPDLSSVRIGMQLLSRHIDNMSRLCRVRFEMVQLRQVRQMWDELQRSWIELQNAVEGSSANVDNRLSEPSTSRDNPLPSTSRDTSLRYPPSRNPPSLDLAVPSTSRGPSNSLTSQDLPSLSNSFREIGLPSTSFRDLSQPSTSRVADTSPEMSDTSPNPVTPLASARREISSVTPVTSSTSGVDSEGDGSSGSYSRPPLLSFRRSARTSASKRARFESALRSNQGARGRPRTRVYGDNGLRPSTVPATDEASDDEETRSPQNSSLPSQSPSLVSQNRRKRTFLPTLTTHEGFSPRGGRQYNGSRVSRSGSSSGSTTPIRFIRHRLGCALHRPPSSASTQTSSRHQTSFFRTTNSRESSSQTPPFLIDASVGTEPEGDDSAEYGSAAGRLRARQALHQMIESLLDFLENDFTRNLPADALHRRIVCLYNLLQRALELTQTLIVQIMPLPSRSNMNTGGDATPHRGHSVMSPYSYDHRRAPLRRSSTLSTSSPPSSSSSGSESVRTIPSLQVNDAPMDDTDLENNSGLGRRGAASRPPGPIGRPPRWADLPPPGPPGHPARIIHLSPVDDSTDDSSSSHVYIDPSFYIRCHNIGLTHRIQAWDFSDCKIPDISNGQKNVVVGECRVHNDASVDISKDGKLLVALLPSVSMGPITNTNMLGIYSLEWATLGQCLYRTVCVQNAVSVSLSPTSRHLIVGLTSKRSLMSLNIPQYLAQVCRLNGGEAKVGGEKAGNLVLMRGIKLPTNSDTISVNCIRWIPQPGAGFVYGTNTGQLKILR